MSLVSIRKTMDYRQETVDAAIARHFEALGVEKDLRPGMKVTLKPNLLTARRPEQAVTTHPSVLLAVAKWLRDRGIEDITVADSPGGPYVTAALKTVYSVSGLKALEGHFKLNFDTGFKEIRCPEGFQNRSFNIINPLAQADYIINIAKLKTHSMTTLSAGIKNLFGAIPGLQKPEFHYKYPELRDFSNMLLEIAATVKPDITVIDAVEAMEGNGPNGGDMRYMGLTLASRNVYAQDYVAARLMGLDPESIAMLKIALEKGLFSTGEIELAGDTVQPPETPFKLPDSATLDFMSFVPKIFREPARRMMANFLRPLPKLEYDKCIGCGKCAESCPPHIIKITGGRAVFPTAGCISCFCCQEMCPVHAIKVKRNLRRVK
jgi:uncharacterized protein (DUF362 family)/ferredoxin